MFETAPVLRQSRWLRFTTLCLLYGCQGLPIGLFQVAIPTWFASQGMELAQVAGFIAIVFLPWSFKLFAGPIMDRFSFPAMGRRRPWVLFAQSGLIFSFILLAILAPDPKESYYLLAAIGFLANVFGSVQDVAVDGMAIDILDNSERAQANAYMFGGQVAGISLSGAVGSVLLVSSGLTPAAMVMAVAIFVVMMFPLVLRERPGERLLPWTSGVASKEALAAVNTSWRDIVVTLVKALILPMSLLLIVVGGLQRTVGGIMVAINPVITVQTLGWEQTEFTNWVSFAGIVAAVLGVLCGAFIDRAGVFRVLAAAIFLRFLLFAAFGFFESAWTSVPFYQSMIMVSEISQQIVTISIIALFMRICLDSVSATQFAVYMASANLFSSFGSAILVALSEVLSHPQMFYFAAGLNLVFLLLLPFVDLERQDRDNEALQQSLEQPTERQAA